MFHTVLEYHKYFIIISQLLGLIFCIYYMYHSSQYEYHGHLGVISFQHLRIR